MDILLVDDDAAVLETIGGFLYNRGHCLRLAVHGVEALRCLEDRMPDLVLTDIQMPVMDGVSLLRAIRDRFPDLSVVLMTGHATVDTAVAALRLGAKDYLKKPVQLDALLACIQRIDRSQR